ncbi:hypothetical protein SGPA1_30570 [Streptomyces misionensis JCM 4497]
MYGGMAARTLRCRQIDLFAWQLAHMRETCDAAVGRGPYHPTAFVFERNT